MENYPYNHNYKMSLSIGLCNAIQFDFTNPATESTYSRDEWEALPDEKRQEWLESELKEWVNGLIDASIGVD